MTLGQRIAEALLIAGGIAFVIAAAFYPLTMIAWLIVSFVACSFIGTRLHRINER